MNYQQAYERLYADVEAARDWMYENVAKYEAKSAVEASDGPRSVFEGRLDAYSFAAMVLDRVLETN